MPGENEALTREVFEAINRRDLEGFVRLLHPEVEFDSLIAEAEGHTFRGEEGARLWWDLMEQALGGVEFEFVGYEDLGEGFGVIGVRARGTAAGVRIEQSMWQASQFRDGMPAWWHVCRTRAEALEALALKRAE